VDQDIGDNQVKPRMLLEVVRERIRLRHLSYATEKSYLGWVRRYVQFHQKLHPRKVGTEGISRYLSYLAIQRNCSPNTQNQALNALVFLYRDVLNIDLGQLSSVSWARKKQRIPEVMTRSEVKQVLAALSNSPQKWLIACLLYGCGLRLSEALRLRVKDVDFGQEFISIRDAKGNKDRIVPLPKKLIAHLHLQLNKAKQTHLSDLSEGFGRVSLPYALQRKYPRADKEWVWQYIFPSTKRSRDPRSGDIKRHHLYDTYMEEALKAAAITTGLSKRITCHTFRHSFATHLLENGKDIRLIQVLLGHSDVRTTMIYTHVAKSPVPRVISPIDEL